MKYTEQGAIISACGAYRYALWRAWGAGNNTVMFVGLNPSTADAEQDDATIRKCVGFAKRWGMNRLVMANVCGFRSRDPKEMQRAADPVGPGNFDTLRGLVSDAQIVVAAWGQNKLRPEAREIAKWVLDLPHMRRLGLNLDGSPRHPLFVSYDTPLGP